MAIRTQDYLLLDIDNGLSQFPRVLAAAAHHEKAQSLGGFLADTGQPFQFGDEFGDAFGSFHGESKPPLKQKNHQPANGPIS
jgi:hypothetical protein